MVDTLHKLKGPIFILGAHKSGTSLMRSFFDGHNDLEVIPIESHFMEHIGMLNSNEIRKANFENRTFKKSIIDLLEQYNGSFHPQKDANVKGDINLEKVCAFLNSIDLTKKKLAFKFEILCRAILLAFDQVYDDEKIIVEKSVENYEYVPYLRNLFPNSIFIHIVRNPYANLVSLRKFKTNKNYPSLIELILTIKRSFKSAINNSIFFNNYYVIKYEELITDTDILIKNLTGKLGIKNLPQLVIPTMFGRPWLGNSRNEISSGQVYNNDLNPVELYNIEIEWINRYLREYLKHFKYEMILNKKSAMKMAKKERISTYLRNRLGLLFGDLS